MRALLALFLVASTAPAAPAQGRLAVLVGPSHPAIARPSYARWANAAADQFTTMFSITAVPAPPDSTLDTVSPAMCGTLNVVGFLQPFRRTIMNQTKVSITVWFTIFDCDGNRFFQDQATQTEARNKRMIPQVQIDSVSLRATAKLLREFESFKEGHHVAWSRLVTAGSIRDVAPTSPPTASPGNL